MALYVADPLPEPVSAGAIEKLPAPPPFNNGVNVPPHARLPPAHDNVALLTVTSKLAVLPSQISTGLEAFTNVTTGFG